MHERAAILQLKREDVIREEIDTAIDLVWSGGSHISANLLAWAAIDQLRGVAKAKSRQSLGDDVLHGMSRDDIRKWFAKVKAPYNYAKHADKDPASTILLHVGTVDLAILQAIIDYQICFDRLHASFITFQSWMYARMPDLLKPENREMLADANRLFGADHSLNHAREVWQEYKTDPAHHEGIVQRLFNRRADGSRA